MCRDCGQPLFHVEASHGICHPCMTRFVNRWTELASLRGVTTRAIRVEAKLKSFDYWARGAGLQVETV